MNSLQEQLLKAGLSDKKRARQASIDKKKKTKQARHNAKHKIEVEDELKKEVAQKKAQQQAKNQAMAQQQKQAQEEKEKQARIKQILEHNGLKDYDGELAYNFTYNNLVKKIHVNEQVHKSIVKGTLAICVFAEAFYLIPETIASRLAQLDSSVIASLNDKLEDEVDEDDPYADFAIPDDLMW